MRNHIKTVLKLSTLSAALLAAGCGGGGGDTAASPGSGEMAVAGVAAKGLIKKGIVQVYALNSQGVKGTNPIATTITGDDGSYSLRIPKDVLNFVIEVGADSNTKMADEATGQDIPMPTTMKLRNAVALAQAPDATYTSNLSPLTEMAVKAAETAGGLSKDNISKAKSGVIAAMGFDPENVKPINANSDAASNATEEQKKQSLVLAAISKLAKDAAISECTSDVACVVNKVASAATITGDNLVLSANVADAISTKVEEVTHSEINKTGKTSTDDMVAFKVIEAPTSPVTVTPLQAAKKLIASVRNTATALHNDSNNGVLDVNPEKLHQDFTVATEPLDGELLDWMKILPQGIGLFKRYVEGTSTVYSTPMYSGGFLIGNCSLYSDTTGNTPVSSTNPVAASVGCSTYPRYIPGTYTPGSGFQQRFVTKNILLVPGQQTNTYSYKSVARRYEQSYNSSGILTGSTATTLGDYGPSASDRATGSISYTSANGFVTGVTINGMMPARVDYSTGQAITAHEVWNVNFTRTAEGSNVFKYTLAGDVTSKKRPANGGDFIDAGKITVGSGSFARVQEDGNGNIAANGMKEVSLLVSGGAGSSTVTGTLSMAYFKADKSGRDFRPTKVTFKGALATNSAEFFSGTLSHEDMSFDTFDTSKPESPTNFNKEVVVVAGSITIPQRPALGLTVSVTRKAIGSFEVSGQYRDGTAVINVNATKDASGESIKVSSADGASVILAQGQETADLTKDSVKVAVINTKTGVINYTDGSFESLK